MNDKKVQDTLKDAKLAYDLIVLLFQYRLVKLTDLRNAKIKLEHQIAKSLNEEIKVFVSKAAKQYSLSENQIERIIYGKSSKRKFNNEIATDTQNS